MTDIAIRTEKLKEGLYTKQELLALFEDCGLTPSEVNVNAERYIMYKPGALPSFLKYFLGSYRVLDTDGTFIEGTSTFKRCLNAASDLFREITGGPIRYQENPQYTELNP